GSQSSRPARRSAAHRASTRSAAQSPLSSASPPMPSEHAPELAADLPSFLADKTPSSAALTIVSSGPEAPARKRECPPICGLGPRSGAVHGGAQPTDRRLQLVAEVAEQAPWAAAGVELADRARIPRPRVALAGRLPDTLASKDAASRPDVTADDVGSERREPSGHRVLALEHRRQGGGRRDSRRRD